MEKKKIGIYLAGSIKKAHENQEDSFWTEKEILELKKGFKEYEVIFLNPAYRSDNLSDQVSVFGRDMTQVFCSHAVFVDARERRGLGVGAEMMWAKLHQIPVITWAPKESHYHKAHTTILGEPVKDFIHPFVLGLSDFVAQSLQEGAQWLEQLLLQPNKAKGIKEIQETMQYYLANQFPSDLPMKEILSYSEFEEKLNLFMSESLEDR